MNLKKWVQLSLANLLIVSLLGVVLRYKIAFSLPFIDQKKLLHGHSHFAFSGWVSLVLMALIVSRLSVYNTQVNFKRYNWLLWANVICGYGMLLSFPVQGYGLFSIFFSTCALFVAYIFMVYVWRDINRAGQQSILFPWIKAAVFFNSLSSLGAFSLAYMMATGNMHQTWYLGAVYFFLHFQYNGWFSFTVLGLLFEKLAAMGIGTSPLKTIFRLFAIACIPAYFLSALWMPINAVVYAAVVLSALFQMAAWIWTLSLAWSKRLALKAELPRTAYVIFGLSLIAFTIKFFLQLGSTIPTLSTLAFGFRPIVIGYLHLVLLGVISLFIIGYVLYNGIIVIRAKTKLGLTLFISGIILNELALMIQGMAAMEYISVPYINEVLFGIAILMFTGLLVVNIPFRKSTTQVVSMAKTANYAAQ